MRTFLLLLLGCCAYSTSCYAQENILIKQLELLKEQITEVDLGKVLYEQSLEYDSNEPYKVTITVEEIDTKSKKGNSTLYSYDLNLGLLDKNAVRRVSNKREMKVTLDAREDIFQSYEDEEWEGYTDKLEIMCRDIEHAKELEKIFEEAIRASNDDWEGANVLPTDVKDLLEWIAEQIGDVEIGEKMIEQNMTLGEKYIDIITLEQTPKGEKITTTFSMGDLRKNSVSYDVQGDKVQISITTDKGRDFILIIEEEEMEYGDDLILYSRDPSQATLLVKAIKTAIPLCDSLIQLRLPQASNRKEAADHLQRELVDFNFNDKSYEQSITSSCSAVYQWSESGEDNTTYKFLWGDMDRKSAEIKVGKELIAIELETTSSENYIEVIEDGELDGYENKLAFLAPNVEAARVIMAVLDTMIRSCPVRLEAKDLKWLDQALQRITDRNEELSQSIIETKTGNPCKLTYSVTEKEDTEEYEFDLADIDLRKLDLSIRGKTIELNLNSKSNEEAITITDEKQDVSYDDDLDLFFPDVESGRVGILTLQALGEGCKD